MANQYSVFNSDLFNICDLIKFRQTGNAPKWYELPPIYDRAKSFYGRAHVVEWNGCKYLVSYYTTVARIDKDGSFHRLWGGYSATTMRHINSFLCFNRINGGGKKWWMAQPVEVERRAM
jgi:hypothetical protein